MDTVETPPGEGAGGAARTPRMRYLIYDAMRIGGEDLTHRTLLYRLRRALTDVVLPKDSGGGPGRSSAVVGYASPLRLNTSCARDRVGMRGAVRRNFLEADPGVNPRIGPGPAAATHGDERQRGAE